MQENTEPSQQTILFDQHQKLGGKIVPFGGWMMPVSYSSVLDEHNAVRNNVGLFDVSHMGEIMVSGSEALSFLQSITINDAAKLEVGAGQYSAMCNESGGMIDDLIIYRLEENKYLLCVNASNTDKDYSWVKKQVQDYSNVTAENESSQWSQLAVQGPTSFEAISAICESKDIETVKNLAYTHICPIKLFRQDALIARTGYTGEKGYELYLPNAIAEQTWVALLETQGTTKIQPIGLGARDTLRLEACYLLYGSDMDDSVSPLEAGIGWATKIESKDFIGKDKIQSQKAAGVSRRIYAFKLEDKGIARHGMKVLREGEEIGEVTSGSVLPTVGGSGGMAMLKTGMVKVGDQIEVDIRGKKKAAIIMKRPLYQAKVKT